MIENLSDRIYEPSEVTFNDDLKYVLDESAYACTFKPSEKNSLLYVEAQGYFVKEYEAKKNATKASDMLMLLILLFVFCLLYNFFGDNISEGLAIFVFFIVSVVAILFKKFISSENQERLTLKIDDHNCSKYQLRRMSDDRFCIICGSNFNENNETIGESYIAEIEPTYSDLIILEEVEYIEQFEYGVIIRGNTIVRKYEPDKPYNKYTQLESPVAMDVFIQKGVYPKDMLKNIGDEF